MEANALEEMQLGIGRLNLLLPQILCTAHW